MTLVALAVSAGACTGGAAQPAEQPDPARATEQAAVGETSADDTGSDSGSGPATASPEEGSALTDRRSGNSQSRPPGQEAPQTTDLQRRVAEILSRLGAERRGSDTVVTLPDQVLFDFDEHVLREDAATVLDELVEVLAVLSRTPVKVHGHTDSVGATAYNQHLSERRAEAVVDYLVAAGADAGRLTARGFGEGRPIASNTHADGSDDPEGRARNRRVEIILEGTDLRDLPD